MYTKLDIGGNGWGNLVIEGKKEGGSWEKLFKNIDVGNHKSLIARGGITVLARKVNVNNPI